MELNTKIWMTGALEWYGYIGDEEVFLGQRNFPVPIEEGDEWVAESGDKFKVIDGYITRTGHTEPPQRYW